MRNMKIILIMSLIGGLLCGQNLIGCAGRQQERTLNERTIILLQKLSCEDSMFVGFASSYLGHEKWIELSNAYKKAIEGKKFGCQFE
jgi:hypothetical protein